MPAIIEIGQLVEVKIPRGVPVTFVVQGYNENDYMKLINTRNQFESMTIHPAHAQRIKDNPEGDSGIKMLNRVGIVEESTPTTKAIATRASTLVKTTKAVKTIPTQAAKEPSKKERAAKIKADFGHLGRKVVIQMFMTQLDMSPAGASTYYSYK